tara:strand:- start:1504 stop:2160 length:657 start_codon:yes stop_codon:yes gene_type:complete
MEIKRKKITMNSSKSPKSQTKSTKSIDKYKEFLGDKKDVKKSKDKKNIHIVRKRASPKRIKKAIHSKDLLQIENEISIMKSKDKSNSIQMPTQNENLTNILNKTVQSKPIEKKPIEKKPIEKPIEKKPVERSMNRQVSRKINRSKKKNRKISVKTSIFNEKDFKQVESKMKEIRKKKTQDIKKELESQGVKVSGKSNRLLRDIYLYSKMSNINITHEK